MLDALPDLLASIEAGILALAGSAWIYPALATLTVVDGFFPPIPSESVIVALAVFATSTGEPHLLLVTVVAALGAFCGDQLAYTLGRRVGTRRFRVLRGPRGRRAVARVERTLARRGASLIFAARFVPGGRVAVNVGAGAVGYQRRRFVAVAALAAVTWAGTMVGVGLTAGHVFGDRPLVAVALGICLGATLGFVIDRVLSARERRAAGDRQMPTMKV